MEQAMHFDGDEEAARFVQWAESEWGLPPTVQRAAQEAEKALREKGWTRHGYIGDVFVPPGEFYVRDLNGSLPADNPRVIAGQWKCLCGFETDRLAHADGHLRLGEEGRTQYPGPHRLTELERIGPVHDDETIVVA